MNPNDKILRNLRLSEVPEHAQGNDEDVEFLLSELFELFQLLYNEKSSRESCDLDFNESEDSNAVEVQTRIRTNLTQQ